MIKEMDLTTFLARNRISDETWQKAQIDWSLLKAIASNHEIESAGLEDSADFFGKTLQKVNCVHSVRWRVKNAEHLAEKIVRKRSEGSEKYLNISMDNYHEIVTDLIGIRALHLFKNDCFEIDKAIKSNWTPIEDSVAYTREGDSLSMRQKLKDNGFEVKDHPAGYRSIHYVISSKPFKKQIIAEIQVRTIFEEGWSEIDHTVRYPNYTDNLQVKYFLEIFNRMAGSADDMGEFVLGLVSSLNEFEITINTKNEENKGTLDKMERAVAQLETEKKQSAEYKDNLKNLRDELSKLKNSKDRIDNLNALSSDASSTGGLIGLFFKGKEAQKGLLNSGAGLDSITKFEEARKTALGINNSFNSALEVSKGLLNSGAGLDSITKFEETRKTALGINNSFNSALEVSKGLLNKDK